MAKKDNSPAISFFSFQDIITSITGIMFLVVMMLVLLVVSRSVAPTARERQVDEKVATLQRQLDALKAMVAARSASRDDLRRQVEELKKLDLATLRKKRTELILQMEHVAATITQEKHTRAELEKQLAAARVQEAQLSAEEKQLVCEQNDVEKLLKESAREKENLAHKLEHVKKLTRFVWQGNTAKRPLVAVCSKEEIAVQDGLTGKPLFSVQGQGKVLTTQFLVWCRAQNTAQHYIVLVAKPSSFTYVEDLSDQLSKLGFERGREILPDDELDLAGGN